MTPQSEAIIGLYQRHAAAWADDRGNRLFEQAWLDGFRRLLRPGASILDIGCGTGEPLARYFLERGYAVTSVDAAPAMLAIRANLFPTQSWQTADMGNVSLGATFDGILAWDSFFRLAPEAQRAMFPIFRAHAAPRAALMFTSGTSQGAIGACQGEPLYHASLHGAEYESLLEENGFDVVDHAVEDPSGGGHAIWLARLR